MRNVTVIPAYNEAKQIESSVRALYAQPTSPDAVVVVDNASTDATADIIHDLQRHEPSLHLVTETRKGTGIACNAGFQYAIGELMADVIARTDADTLVRPGWTAAINNRFTHDATAQLVGGPSFPRDDEFYGKRDSFLWMPLRRAHMLTMAASSREPAIARLAIGHNSAITASAYESVGGFPDSDISEVDEDIQLTRRVAAHYGDDAVVYDRAMQVETSMRRVRAVGYIGLGKYYTNPAEPQPKDARLAMTDGMIDIR